MPVALPLPIKNHYARARNRRGDGTFFRGAVFLALVLLLLGGGWWWKLRDETKRATAYDHLIVDAAQRNRLPPALVKAVVRKESDFRASAVGDAGEIGLMQITSGAVEDWKRARGKREIRFRGQLFDPALNLEIGTWYLARAMKRWEQEEDQVVLALAQYNAGGGKVNEWVKLPRRPDPVERIGYSSTRHYIRAILEYRKGYDEQHSFP